MASPLGAWLLLALAGPACAGDDLRQLEEILGTDADAAAGLAAELLAHPHPVVHAAAAVWGGNGSAADARIASWRAGLPSQVDTGPVPGNAQGQDSHHPVPHSPWHGLPVFSAWVADPEDATAEPNSTG